MNIKIPIQEIEKKLKYKFKKKKLINDCFIHPSFLKKNKKLNNNFVHEFERLEFLGDRVLGIVIASLIFNKFNEYDEGTLSKKFSLLVQRDFLYKIALKLNLNDFVKVNNKNFNLKSQKSILSDTLESIIGAIYIDGGFDSSRKFITSLWMPYLDLTPTNKSDPKSTLQEVSQKKYKKLPEYKLVSKKGPPHSPVFTVSLKALNFQTIKDSGHSIRDAEKNAAKKILDMLDEQ